MSDATYPEHEKMAKIKDEANLLSDFMEWLEYTKDIELPESTLYEYFEIDAERVNAEKEAMLDSLGG